MDACTAKKSVKELSETVQVLSVHVKELRNATVFPKSTLLGKFPRRKSFTYPGSGKLQLEQHSK